MTIRAAQLPLDPATLSRMLSHERGKLYAELGLDRLQVAAAEEACRAVLRGKYRRAAA